MNDTSLQAYESEVRPKLGEKQAAVRRLLLNYPAGLTNVEIGKALGWPVNTVTPRIYELRKMGAVLDAGKRECHFTGRMAHVWKLKYQPAPQTPTTPTTGSLFSNQSKVEQRQPEQKLEWRQDNSRSRA